MKENAIWRKVHLKFLNYQNRTTFRDMACCRFKILSSAHSRRDISVYDRFRHLYNQNPDRQNNTNFMILIIHFLQEMKKS